MVARPSGLARRAGTQQELRLTLGGAPAPEERATFRGAQGPVRVRDRVGDWLTRALTRAVFCWLPPPHR